MVHCVTLQPSGHRFEVPDGLSVLDAGLKAKFAMPYSCKTGVCRTCRGTVLEGQVDYGMVHPNYLSDSDKARGYALLCQAKPRTDVVIQLDELEGLAGIEPKMVPCRVARIERPAPDVAVVRLRLPMNENMRFLAGQYVEFLLQDGKRRSYSIATPPRVEGVTSIELHIRHSPGGLFSDKIFSGAIRERDLLRFEGPFGTFYLRDSPKPIVMIASGTGFAPLKAICEAAFERNVQASRPIKLYWGGRTKRDLYMLDVPAGWVSSFPGFEFIPVLSEPTADCGWTGRTGFVHRAVMDDFTDLSDFQVYACGAPAMVDAGRRDLTAARNLPAAEFLADSFLTEADRNVAAKTE